MSTKDQFNDKKNADVLTSQSADNGKEQTSFPTDFLTISSIQSLRLLFSLRQNFEPLFDKMRQFPNFDEFIMKTAGKSFEEIMKGGK